jgi:hypothetical protein
LEYEKNLDGEARRFFIDGLCATCIHTDPLASTRQVAAINTAIVDADGVRSGHSANGFHGSASTATPRPRY